MAAPLSIVLLAYSVWPQQDTTYDLIHQERSFFGVLRVVGVGAERSPQHQLMSGSTLHGVQFRNPRSRRIPSSYFGHATGIGFAFSVREQNQSMKVGIVGLGIGTLSSYGREGDFFRFYEIDPAVVRIARDARYFTFLEDSRAEIDVLIGDARLLIAQEQMREGSQQYDILVVDAFSSDAIPVHLLTLEAFRIYAEALSAKGVIAVHVSNRYFNLMPLVARVGFEAGVHSLYASNTKTVRYRSQTSHWVFLSPDVARLNELKRSFQSQAETMGLTPRQFKLISPSEADVKHTPLWTDDYSDLLGVMWSTL